MLMLYGMGSPNVVKVLLLLEELALDYTLERVDVIAGTQQEPWFLALNPNGKVPVLIDRREGEPLVLSESGAILLYLSERHRAFAGNDPRERAQIAQWLMFQMSGAGPMFGQAIHFDRVARDVPYARDRFLVEMRRLLGVVAHRLDAFAYLASDAYTIADMALWPWINTLRVFFPDDLSTPSIVRWSEAIKQRAATARAMTRVRPLQDLDRATMRAASTDQLDRYFGRRS